MAGAFSSAFSAEFGGSIVPDVGSLSLTGQTPTRSITGVAVAVPAGSLVLSGQTPTRLITTATPVGAAALALSGPAPEVRVRTICEFTSAFSWEFAICPGTIGQAVLSLTGYAPTVLNNPPLAAAALVLTGLAPLAILGAPIAVGAGVLTLTGYTPSLVVTAAVITVPTGSLTLSGQTPLRIIFEFPGMSPDRAILRIKGYKPALTFTFPEPIDPPIDPPGGPKTDCAPQAETGSGGRGAAGCNTGGVGFVTAYTGPFGDVPAHDDPVTPDAIGNGTIDLWVEIVHADEPTRVGPVPLADTDRVRGGLLPSGSIEHALGNEQGGYEVSTLSLGFNDDEDRLFRSRPDEIEGDELRVKIIAGGV